MKVAYIDEAKIPSLTANSVHVMKMCQAISQVGHEVCLIVPKWVIEQDLQSVDLMHHYGLKTKFDILWLPRLKSWGSHLFAILSVIKSRMLHVDIIYTRTLAVAGIAAAFGIPVICEFHAVPTGNSVSFYLKLLTWGNGLRKLVVITEALFRDLLLFAPALFNTRSSIIAPDGVDLERFFEHVDYKKMRHQIGLKDSDFVAGYSGHFYKGKGMEIVLRLASLCPNVKFLIMGGTPSYVTQFETQCYEEKIQNIMFCGFVPNAELPNYLFTCDVLLLPNQKHVSGVGGNDIGRWTSPMKLFEYMATGKLIIASDLPVLREILNETNACFCDPENVEDWQQVLMDSQINEDLRVNRGRKARLDVQKFDWLGRVERCLE